MKKERLAVAILVFAFAFALAVLKILSLREEKSIEMGSSKIANNPFVEFALKLNKNENQGIFVKEIKSRKEKYAENPEDTDIICVEGKLTKEDWNKRINYGICEQNVLAIFHKCGMDYSFCCLNEDEKELYAEIYIALTGHASDVVISTVNEARLDKVYNCVLADHPEIYYVDGYTYTKYKAEDEIVKIAFHGNECFTTSEQVQMNQAIEEYTMKFMKGISKASSDYDKIKYTYEYIILNTEYDENSSMNQNICSVMVNGRSVCQGYAKSMQYLLDKLGVQSTLVVGNTKNGLSHAWNLVKADGAYYYVDATWGDASFGANSESEIGEVGIIYDYLCITTNEIQNTHVIKNYVPVPTCVTKQDNYYVKENLYFQYLDENHFRSVFGKALSSSNKMVSIKCSDARIYEMIFNYLIVEQNVFQYLPEGVKSMNYTYNEKLYTITFFF